MIDGDPDIREALVELAEGSIASQETIEELLDVDVIREEHGKITEEILRRHVSSVEQTERMFGHHRGDD